LNSFSYAATLPISGVRKTRRPKRAAIDELGLLSEPLIVFEDGRPLDILTLISIFLHLVGAATRSSSRIEPTTTTSGSAALTLFIGVICYSDPAAIGVSLFLIGNPAADLRPC
jgi:hypothetical protein